jgi:purine-binding chemotaxis protein CheW
MRENLLRQAESPASIDLLLQDGDLNQAPGSKVPRQLMAVREIKGWTAVTPLPDQPEYVRGVLSLRGVVVPIVDLRCRFGQGLTAAIPLHIVIIVQIASKLVGLLGDCVLDIVSLNAEEIKPLPPAAQSHRQSFLRGLAATGGAIIALVDLPNLLSSVAS